MTFLTSILLGLSMGKRRRLLHPIRARRHSRLKGTDLRLLFAAGRSYGGFKCPGFCRNRLDHLVMKVPDEIQGYMKDYLVVIFAGLAGIFLYNYFASLLRALGNSKVPLLFLAVSAILNIFLDLWFVLGLKRGVAGAAEATVISQYVSGIGIAVYAFLKFPLIRPQGEKIRIRLSCMKEIISFSALTCIQQSVMNLGILMVQGRVNSFGPAVMAAFAAAVKIDAFAYMPVQDFGNAVSTFIAQNYGAGQEERIRKGLKYSILTSMAFCLFITTGIWLLARPLMLLFVDAGETAIIAEGVRLSAY